MNPVRPKGSTAARRIEYSETPAKRASGKTQWRRVAGQLRELAKMFRTAGMSAMKKQIENRYSMEFRRSVRVARALVSAAFAER